MAAYATIQGIILTSLSSFLFLPALLIPPHSWRTMEVVAELCEPFYLVWEAPWSMMTMTAKEADCGA
jgi:hypothetical protein